MWNTVMFGGFVPGLVAQVGPSRVLIPMDGSLVYHQVVGGPGITRLERACGGGD